MHACFSGTEGRDYVIKTVSLLSPPLHSTSSMVVAFCSLLCSQGSRYPKQGIISFCWGVYGKDNLDHHLQSCWLHLDFCSLPCKSRLKVVGWVLLWNCIERHITRDMTCACRVFPGQQMVMGMLALWLRDVVLSLAMSWHAGVTGPVPPHGHWNFLLCYVSAVRLLVGKMWKSHILF